MAFTCMAVFAHDTSFHIGNIHNILESVFLCLSKQIPDYNANQCFLISEIVDRLGTPQQLSALGQYTLCVYKFFPITGQLQFTIYL